MKRKILIAVVVLALAGASSGWWADRNAGQRDRAVRAAMAASTAAAQAIFSYDYRSFDTSVANGRSFVTGGFADEYGQTTAALKNTAVQKKAVARAAVSAAGVVTASRDRVELLLFLNQYRRNANIDGEKVDQNRVVLTMVSVHGDWKVSAAAAI
jgi:Mce-associated membrane protein